MHELLSRQGDPLRLSVRVHIVQPRLRRREAGHDVVQAVPDREEDEHVVCG